MATGVVWQVAVSLWLCAAAVFAVKMFRVRLLFRRLRNQGLPMPPWNFVSGHLGALPTLLKQFPFGCQQSDVFAQLALDFESTSKTFYMDTWPFGNPLLVVASPELAVQACQEHDLVKPAVLIPFFTPFAGGPNLFTTNGAEWKRSRALFNPGFAANVMLECTPHIVDEADVYVSVLREHARKGDTFLLDKLTCDYMMDVIGTVTINARLHSMTAHNPLATAMRSSVEWHCQDQELNPFRRWNPMRPLVQWNNGRIMNQYIATELDKRYEEWKAGSRATTSVMDIAIASYMDGCKTKPPPQLDADFKAWAIVQIRLFLFAGHDSTAATIVYALHLLSKHPSIQSAIRAEHDAVFGHDIFSVAAQFRARPHLANQLPYTTAVLKETMRLFPPASGMRGGRSDVVLVDKEGNNFPTKDINIWINHSAIHRNADYWPDPHAFLPERWLVGAEDPLHPKKGAWRPFEAGPRNCVGQTLAMLDMKITLAMVVREFEIENRYEEWDRTYPSGGVKTVYGERAYQVPQGASHPVHGFPCRVRFSERAGR